MYKYIHTHPNRATDRPTPYPTQPPHTRMHRQSLRIAMRTLGVAAAAAAAAVACCAAGAHAFAFAPGPAAPMGSSRYIRKEGRKEGVVCWGRLAFGGLD